MSSDVTKIMIREPDDVGERPLAIISDIHANLQALEAVFADITDRGITHVVCLGDVIGYGPNPAECWRLIHEHCSIIIRGNHDQALGGNEMTRFHPRARGAIEWTRDRLLEEKFGEQIIRTLASLPRLSRVKNHLYVHGAPAGPTMDYLLPDDAYDKRRMEREFDEVRLYAFNGHSHIPGVIERGVRFMPPEALGTAGYALNSNKAIINVGSVGQPRDGNPKACYLTIENGMAVHRRIAYDVEETCRRILAIPELDPFLGRRLLAGY